VEREDLCVVVSSLAARRCEGELLPYMWVSWPLSAEGFTWGCCRVRVRRDCLQQLFCSGWFVLEASHREAKVKGGDGKIPKGLFVFWSLLFPCWHWEMDLVCC